MPETTKLEDVPEFDAPRIKDSEHMAAEI